MYLGHHDDEEVVLLDVVLSERTLVFKHLAGMDELLLRHREALLRLDCRLHARDLQKIREDPSKDIAFAVGSGGRA